MADFPISILAPNVTIHPWAWESIGVKLTGQGGTTLPNAVSTAYPTANQALYVPFCLTRPIIVAQLFWVNGATVSGNVDAGIYSVDGVLLVSTGSTAQAGTSVSQVVDITDTQLGTGLFYLAIAVDNTTATLIRGTAGSVARCAAMGCANQGSAFPLPAPATFATIASNYIPVFGLTTRSVF